MAALYFSERLCGNLASGVFNLTDERIHRIRWSLRKPWHDKWVTIRLRFKLFWNWLCPGIPLPVKLPNGGWWFAVNDYNSDAIFSDVYEKKEQLFVGIFLKPGMTVIDIGAHHGFYALLATKKVGPSGTVIAFEPSPRERKRLLFHLKVNRCTNVKVEPFALAADDGESKFFIVEGRDTGCNSLRPPVVQDPVRSVKVQTMTLDHYLSNEAIHRVDFIKLDAEGSELDILRGAESLLNRPKRPVILFESSDTRTRPWNYKAKEIGEILLRYHYELFALDPDGRLVPSPQGEGNFVGVPK